MRKLLGLALASLAFLAQPALAADNPQQERMKACNQDAADKNLTGDARKKFMGECLSARKMTQQEKMVTCNKDASAKNLKGDERKQFMSECLKG